MQSIGQIDLAFTDIKLNQHTLVHKFSMILAAFCRLWSILSFKAVCLCVLTRAKTHC